MSCIRHYLYILDTSIFKSRRIPNYRLNNLQRGDHINNELSYLKIMLLSFQDDTLCLHYKDKMHLPEWGKPFILRTKQVPQIYSVGEIERCLAVKHAIQQGYVPHEGSTLL
jgi:hypothetical protein